MECTSIKHITAFLNGDLHDALVDEREYTEDSQTLPKWLVQILRDSKLDAPLSSRTHLGSHSAHHVLDCYALVVSNICDEESISFNSAQNSKNWMAPMQSEYDAIMKNGTWSLCDLPLGKKAIGTKWVYKLKCKPNNSVDRYKARLVKNFLLNKRALHLRILLLLLVI